MRRPGYFEEIRARAAARWDQLEADRELAGPWHQLFKQVQSPRHVLSELLQNADDAGATESAVSVDDGVFRFEHNGEDFTADHFASLCRFGYSNKRALHTIGFRGVGFKSIFSLGDRVELRTRTLAVAFHRQRFTEPSWLESGPLENDLTRVEVEIVDDHRRAEITNNLREWEASPLSLLFFRNLRLIRIGNEVTGWQDRDSGPVAGSRWMRRFGSEGSPVLLVRSDPEDFPSEAMKEIQQERLLMTGEEVELPPCQVEIVLGVPGRLFVVLPTGVDTALPFAINAPFVQDPARLKIKDPETSPTNRWLLERAGRLAARTMLDWLAHPELPVSERVEAYGLLPDGHRSDTSLTGAVHAGVEEAVNAGIEDSPILISWDGAVVRSRECIAIPGPLFDVWPPDQVGKLLDDEGRPALAPEVSSANRFKLIRLRLVDELTVQRLLETLEKRELPRPRTWKALLNLWSWIAPDVTSYRYLSDRDALRIVPVQGRDGLCSAGDVVRLGEKRLLNSGEDWEFIADHLLVMNPNWTRFLGEQRRRLVPESPRREGERINAAFDLLERLDLSEATNADTVIERVAEGFFTERDPFPADCARLAQLAAKLGAKAGPRFRFVTRDGRLRSTDQTILYDADGRLEDLLPAKLQDEWLLHPTYEQPVSCSKEEWDQWIGSGRAKVGTTPPIERVADKYEDHRRFERALRSEVGYQGTVEYPYRWKRRYPYQRYSIVDFDFHDELLTHWSSREDDSAWPAVARLFLETNPAAWKAKVELEARQTSTNGESSRTVSLQPVPARWIRRLTLVPCLPDTHGVLREPTELFRRTRETEALQGVEPFLDHRLDNEKGRPLLELLGVRSEPTGPDRLLAGLRALAASDDPPLHAVDRWYLRLDQMLNACSTEDSEFIREALQSEALILSEEGGWETAMGVHLAPDEHSIPGAPVVRSSVRHLTLWSKVGVAERPSVERAIEWLKGVPSGENLDANALPRVKGLLVRHPFRVWEECRHWLALSGAWVPAEDLSYALTMQSLTAWGHLFPQVKSATADFRGLPSEVTSQRPFSDLPVLTSRIEERVERRTHPGGCNVPAEWLNALGKGLQRVKLDSDDETSRVRELGGRLAATTCSVVAELRTIPCIEGVPAGTPRKTDVVWLDRELLCEPLPVPRLARRIPEEIGRVFATPAISAALDFSFDRREDQVLEYLEANFTLADSVPETIGAEESNQASQIDVLPPPEETGDGPPPPAAGEEKGEQTGTEEDAGGGGEPPPARTPPAADPEAGGQPPRPTPPPTLPKPGLLERFARRSGFSANGEGRFVHGNGQWIGRRREGPFSWERRSMGGDLVRCYLPLERCLYTEPLELDCAVWGLLDERPDIYALILNGLRGEPEEVTGADLRARLEAQEIKIYPSSYRLVLTSKTT